LREDTVGTFYNYAKPPDVLAVAERFLKDALEDVDPL
jgi:hypothetical protein